MKSSALRKSIIIRVPGLAALVLVSACSGPLSEADISPRNLLSFEEREELENAERELDDDISAAWSLEPRVKNDEGIFLPQTDHLKGLISKSSKIRQDLEDDWEARKGHVHFLVDKSKTCFSDSQCTLVELGLLNKTNCEGSVGVNRSKAPKIVDVVNRYLGPEPGFCVSGGAYVKLPDSVKCFFFSCYEY